MPATDSAARVRRERQGLRVARVHDSEGRLSPEFLTNLNARVQGYSGRPGGRRGAAMINVAVGLLLALAIGLYAVSLKAQFHYVMAVKHDDQVSWIEAVALDAGMAIFTLLALGLARAGQSARIERLAIVACALGSAGMNLAAADSADARSVLAYVMPPVFLALVVDRTVAVVRRHFLGESDASAWSQLVKVVLYVLRFALAPASTARGIRRCVLDAAPVPEPLSKPAAVQVITPRHERKPVGSPKVRPIGSGRADTKTARFLALVEERHGPLAAFPLEKVARTCVELAPEVGLDAGAARTALRRTVKALQNGNAS
jgi:hypothetical protein